MTTIDDLLQMIGELYVRNRMLENALQAAQNAPTEEQEEKDVQLPTSED